MLVLMQLQFTITLNNDAELIFKADAAADGRIVIDRFLLWVPKMIPKDSLFNRFVSSFLKESTWTYLREMYNFSTTPRQTRGFFKYHQVSTMFNMFLYISR